MKVNNIFGTDGIRSPVGTGIMTVPALCSLGQALGQWAHKHYNANPRIIIMHDTRNSCAFVKAALKSGLLLYPVQIYDAGILPTPGAAHIMGAYNCDIALVISASHNVWSDNGIKIIDKMGKINAEHEREISQLFFQNKHHDHVTPAQYGTDVVFEHAQELYKTSLHTHFLPNFLKGKKIVLDCAHGATYAIAPAIVKSFGAEVIAIHNEPTGFNINDRCGALHSETLARMVIDQKAYAGFAFDGDGDRVVAVNHAGKIKDGDDILALLSLHPAYKAEKTLVGTHMTNQGFYNFLKSQDKLLARTAVGDKYISEYLIQNNLLLGGEPAGHIIMSDINTSGDGIAAALRVLEAMELSDNHGMNTYDKYPQVLLNIPVLLKKDLSQEPYCHIINNAIETNPEARILVRYSGTENLLRIMVEAESHTPASSIACTLKDELEYALNSTTMPDNKCNFPDAVI